MKNNTVQKIREFKKYIDGLYFDGKNSQAEIKDIEAKGKDHTTFKILIKHEKEDFVLTYDTVCANYNQNIFKNNGFECIAPIGYPSINIKGLSEEISFIIVNQYQDQEIKEVYIDAGQWK